MKVVISGATGFVGSALKKSLSDCEIVSLGSKDFNKTDLEFTSLLEGSDIIVNLAGAPIVARWSQEYKKVLYSSRIDTTRKIVTAMERLLHKPKLFISTSAVGVYSGKKVQKESDCEFANDFLGMLCQDWETEAMRAQDLGIRSVVFRFGIVLGKNGGALQKMLLPFKLGIGGVIGSGEQSFSWVHLEDLVNAYRFAINNNNISGVYNLTAPEPVTNRKLTNVLASVIGMPAFLPVPEFVLKLIYSEGATVLIDGQNVIPERLISSGFNFKFSNIEEAIKDIVATKES